MKKYKGENTLIEPPESGWGVIMFSDGYKCQVALSRFRKKEGKEVIWFYLMPYEATIKKYGIDTKKDLNTAGYAWKAYPIEMVRLLNSYDPSRRVYFCLLDYNGAESENTKWFKGEEQVTEIIGLKKRIRNIKAHVEELKAENFLLKTNVPKYIKEHAGILKEFMPAIKDLISVPPTGGRE